MVQHDAKSFRKLTAGISQEFNDGAIDRLVICPTLHDSTIIDTVNENIRDALGLQLFLFFQVARYLLRRSAGCEGSRKPDENNSLALAVIAQHKLLGREAVVEPHIRDLITNLYRGCLHVCGTQGNHILLA